MSTCIKWPLIKSEVMLEGTRFRHGIKKMLVKAGFGISPQFMIIGAQKAGTTYLFSLLRQHPQIVEPVNKEAHFFDYEKNYNCGYKRYQLDFDLRFRLKTDQMTFE